ncbi:MAG TPA: hypothetical protein VK101_04095 [Limnochordia bacterium]|nr:hypothetical protein [Limnochordia bacterium]
MANQRFRPWFFLAAALWVLSFPAQAARTVVIDTQALRVEGVGDSQVVVMPEFTAQSEEYTLSGASGRFESASETFLATGAPDRPASLERSGESPFTVTATGSITVVFQDESLRAEGDVSYQSPDVRAQSDLLLVDRRDRLEALIQQLLSALPPGETRKIVVEFFARVSESHRLIVMQHDVRVDREDSFLEADWVVFSEENPDDFISVAAPGRPLRLSVVIESQDDQGEDEHPGESSP